MAVTVRSAALRLLRLFGVTSLNPSSPASQEFPIESTDLDDVLGEMNASMQEVFMLGPSEIREQNLSAYLHAPTSVTLNATQGGTTIASLTTYAAWMLGCTIRITGDDQDNELTNSTTLARPYMGSTASGIPATVYADAVQLDATVGRVIAPVSLPNRVPLFPATTREEFMRASGYPLVTDATGRAYGYPFFWFVQKAVGIPLAWFLEGAYDATLSYLPRRIRLGPMPTQAYPLAYRAAINPPRFISTDVDTGDHTTDPNTPIPLPDSFVESIFIPICRQRLSGVPQFKNVEQKQEIARAYQQALRLLQGEKGQSSLKSACYV